MSDKNFKTIRKQLRNVVQEILPQTWNKEAREAVTKEALDAIRVEMNARLTLIETNVKESLATLDGRQKEMQSHMVRSMAALQEPIVSEPPQVGSILAPTPGTETENAAPVQE